MKYRDTDAAQAITFEMGAIVRRAAEPRPVGDSLKALLTRSARRLGISYRRATSYYYGQPCAVRAEEADRMRRLDITLLHERYARLELELATLEAQINAQAGVYETVLTLGSALNA